MPVDENAAYWTKSVDDNDFTRSGYAGVPRLVVSKGLTFGTVAGTYAKVPDTKIAVWGGSFDFPLTRGGLATPTLALRGAYSQLRGVEELELNTYGVELFLSKGFGPITPYGAVGYARSKSTGHVPFLEGTTIDLTDDANSKRYTVGVKLSFFIPKFVIEATQGEERSYAAKISLGL